MDPHFIPFLGELPTSQGNPKGIPQGIPRPTLRASSAAQASAAARLGRRERRDAAAQGGGVGLAQAPWRGQIFLWETPGELAKNPWL